MYNLDLIATLAGGFIAALALGYLTHRLGLSPIVGYLLAGVLLGPHTPGFVADRHMAEQLAELGVILLMFGVGLHFHFKDLMAVRRIAVAGTLVQSTVATGLGALVFHSFLLATLGRQVGALPDGAMNPVVAAAIISIMLNPVLYRWAMPLERFIYKHPRLWRVLNRKASAERDSPFDFVHEKNPTHRAVIVGYGPIGQMVSQILRQQGVEPTVIEMNIETHRRLRSEGQPVVYGDANRREVLEQAGISVAASLILSASGTSAATEAVRVARELNSDIQVVARADYLRETELLRQAGASEVFSGEGEVALAIAGSILRELGATPGQLDESRERIRLNLQRANA